MPCSANVCATERQIAAVRDAAPVMLEIIEGFVLAHQEQNAEALAAFADTALEVLRVVMHRDEVPCA